MWMHRKLQGTQKAKSPSRYLHFTRGIQTQIQQHIMLLPLPIYVKAMYCHCEFLLVQSIGGWAPVWCIWWCADLLYKMWPFPTLCVSPSEEGEYFLKVLIPSYAAGSIIGKGGQTIVQLQKETGATIKLSKSKDFYPGKNGHSVIKIDEHKGLYIWEESPESLPSWRGDALVQESIWYVLFIWFPMNNCRPFNQMAIVNTLKLIILMSLRD